LQQLLTVEGADRVGEAANGTNYGINRYTINMLFDEKMGGTIHMALGNSYPESGGKKQVRHPLEHTQRHEKKRRNIRRRQTLLKERKIPSITIIHTQEHNRKTGKSKSLPTCLSRPRHGPNRSNPFPILGLFVMLTVQAKSE
jgi:hypothetical protein